MFETRANVIHDLLLQRAIYRYEQRHLVGIIQEFFAELLGGYLSLQHGY